VKTLSSSPSTTKKKKKKKSELGIAVPPTYDPDTHDAEVLQVHGKPGQVSKILSQKQKRRTKGLGA
jgi:hypothetical protein